MNAPRFLLLLSCALGCWPQHPAGCAAAATPRVALRVTQAPGQPLSGTGHEVLQAAIDQARQQGGGEIVVGPGEYRISRSLSLAGANRITIRGEPGAVLRLPPLPWARLAEAAAAGAASIRVDRNAGFEPGMNLHFVAPGKLEPFTGRPQPYFLARVERIEPGLLVLKAPLEFPAAHGTMVYREGAPNVFRVPAPCEEVTIERLTLDGGRLAGDPPISGHVIGCGVLAEGRYSYEGGPSAPPVRGLTVRDCVIRHCFGRGVALYATADSVIERCTIEDAVDEAIDFDHFSVRCRAADNVVLRCHVGVELNDANDCVVERNRFESCGTGINLWRWCRQPELNVRNRISQNHFLNTAGSVLQIRAGTAANLIQDNVIEGAGGHGVVLEGSRQTLTGNRFGGTKKAAIVVTGPDHVIRDNQAEEPVPGQGR